MDAPSNLDRRNVLRGKCKAIDCDCELFESAKTSDFCRYCNDPPTKHVSLGLGDVKARDKGDKASLELPEENTNEKATDINNTTLIKQSDSTVDIDKHEESSTFSSSPQPGPSSRLDKDDELDIDKPFADVSSASVVAADLPDDGDGQSKKTDSPVSSSSTKEMTSVLKYSKEVIEREKKPGKKHSLGGSKNHKMQAEYFTIRFCQVFMSPIGQLIQMKKALKLLFIWKEKGNGRIPMS